MSNMSYCRFENTLRDLQDCSRYLEQVLYGDPTEPCEPLSESELSSALKLLRLCQDLSEIDCEELKNLSRKRQNNAST